VREYVTVLWSMHNMSLASAVKRLVTFSSDVSPKFQVQKCKNV